jgi:hypothetical protein
VGRFHSRDTANLIQVTARGHDGRRASIAYGQILHYFEAARTQQRRITRLIQQDDLYISRLVRGNDHYTSRQGRRKVSQIFTEIHFYFIAWNTILNMVKVLISSSRLSCIKPLFSRHKQVLEHYGSGRHDLEHFSERLPGGNRVHTMSAPYDIGNLHGSHFTFGGKKWDVGPKSIEPLKSLVKELEQEVRREAIDRYEVLCNTVSPASPSPPSDTAPCDTATRRNS